MGTSLSLSAPCISHCKRADGQNSINRDPFLGLRWDPFQAARMALCTVGTAVFDVVGVSLLFPRAGFDKVSRR